MSKVNWKIVIAIVMTVLVAAAFIGAFYLGTQFQQHINDQIITQSQKIAQLKR